MWLIPINYSVPVLTAISIACPGIFLYFGYTWNRYCRRSVTMNYLFLYLLLSLSLIQFPMLASPLFYFDFIWPVICLYFTHMFITHIVQPYYFWLSFWPRGVSYWGGLFILPSEMMSYGARPLSTLIRPTVNLVGGAYLTAMLQCKVDEWSMIDLFVMYFWLGYEFAVTCTQWYIVGVVMNFTNWEPCDL